jgi:hypothetical protein
MTLEQKQQIEQARFYVATLGGDPTLAAMIESEGPKRLPDYLSGGARFTPENPGLPLSYVAAHFATDSVIQLSNASRYLIPECQLASDKLQVTLDRFRVNKDGDNIGPGDFRWGFEVTQGGTSESVGMSSGNHKRANGEDLNIGATRSIDVEERNGNCFNVRIRVNEYNDAFSRVDVGLYPQNPEVSFCYSAGRNIWEAKGNVQREGDGYKLPLSAGDVSIDVFFRVDRLHDCTSGLRSDGTLCVQPTAFAINNDGDDDISACYGSPINVDARNLYATSSHLRLSSDKFDVEIHQTDPTMSQRIDPVVGSVTMGSEPTYMLDNRFEVAEFLQHHGRTIQPKTYYSVKLGIGNFAQSTRKRLFVRPLESSFTLNESADPIVHVAHDGPLVLDAGQSCTTGGTYTLTISGPGAFTQRVLSAAEARAINALDLHAYARKYGAVLTPGHTYEVTLAVSSGHTRSKYVVVGACPTLMKWNGSECVIPVQTSVWDWDSSDCFVRSGAGTVGVSDCATLGAQFELLPFGDYEARLQFVGTNECLAAPDLFNSPAVARPCDFSDRVRFEVVPQSRGVVQLVNKHTNQCLSITPTRAPVMTSCASTAQTRLEFDWAHEAAPLPSLAAGMSVSAQSTYTGYSVDRIIDGDRSTALGGGASWANAHLDAPNGMLPQWVEIDLGYEQTFSQVDVYTTAEYPLQDYDILYWDGTDWQWAASVVGNQAAMRSETFLPVTSSRVRILCKRGPQRQVVYARLNEVEIY